MTKSEGAPDGYSAAVDKAVLAVKMKVIQDRIHKKEVKARYNKVVQEFDRFYRGYTKIDHIVEFSPEHVTQSGLPDVVWHFMAAQIKAGSTKVLIGAYHCEKVDRGLRIIFEIKGKVSAELGVAIQPGSENVDIVSKLFENPRKFQQAAKHQLDTFASLEHYENRINVTAGLVAFAEKHTKTFARSLTAEGGK